MRRRACSPSAQPNMDFQRLLKNINMIAIIMNREFAGEMNNMFQRDLAEIRQIAGDEWEYRPLLPRGRERCVNLLSHWL